MTYDYLVAIEKQLWDEGDQLAPYMSDLMDYIDEHREDFEKWDEEKSKEGIKDND